MKRHLLAILSVGIAALLLGGCPGDDDDGADAVADTGGPADAGDVADSAAPPDTAAADTRPADTLNTVDGIAPDCPGGFGCPCTGNDACLDELCVEGPDGHACTRTCTASCPNGYACVVTSAFGTDPVSLCVPQHTRLCRPCQAHADCQNPVDALPSFCLPAGDGAQGSFCGSACATAPCPGGYACTDVVVDGAASRQCVPDEGALCACRPAWADLGFVTSCFTDDAVGVCLGTRSCGPEGLTACAGQAGQDEVCNGVDDDCDGATDEASCDDGLACTDDTCAGAPATCAFTPKAGACVIAGQCWAAGAVNPADPCAVCDPAASATAWSAPTASCLIGGACFAAGAAKPDDPCQTCEPNRDAEGWSPRAELTPCDDGASCTFDDVCVAGVCLGTATPGGCDDGMDCTTDQCNGDGTCTHRAVPGYCAIDAQCRLVGSANPDNPCEVCSPAPAAYGWSPASAATACDDGSGCTVGDHCDGQGACTGAALDCDDGLGCTTDSCDATGCVNSIDTGACVIDGACVAADVINPAQACERCVPAVSAAAWSPVSVGSCGDVGACRVDGQCVAGACVGAVDACDDHDDCTVDRCEGDGACASEPVDCDDGLACTTDSCGAEGCVNTVDTGACVIDGACRAAGEVTDDGCRSCQPALDASAWTGEPVTTACDDGDPETGDDHCDGAGGCAGRTICDDGIACTVDGLSDGHCAFVVAEGWCVIAGACVAHGTVDGGGCQVCDASAAEDGWSPRAQGAPCDDGAACTAGERCDGQGHCGDGFVCAGGAAFAVLARPVTFAAGNARDLVTGRLNAAGVVAPPAVFAATSGADLSALGELAVARIVTTWSAGRYRLGADNSAIAPTTVMATAAIFASTYGADLAVDRAVTAPAVTTWNAGRYRIAADNSASAATTVAAVPAVFASTYGANVAAASAAATAPPIATWNSGRYRIAADHSASVQTAVAAIPAVFASTSGADIAAANQAVLAPTFATWNANRYRVVDGAATAQGGVTARPAGFAATCALAQLAMPVSRATAFLGRPHVSGAVPAIVAAGEGVELTLTGLGFAHATAVRLYTPTGLLAQTLAGPDLAVVSPSELRVVVELPPTAPPGTWTVAVETLAGASSPASLPETGARWDNRLLVTPP